MFTRGSQSRHSLDPLVPGMDEAQQGVDEPLVPSLVHHASPIICNLLITYINTEKFTNHLLTVSSTMNLSISNIFG